MKPLTKVKVFALITLMLASFIASAYEDDKEKEKCRNPKIQEFTLPIYGLPDNKEAPAEAEFSFIVSAWADPKKIKINGKGIDVPYTVDSNDSFHKVKAKLPPEFNGKHVRLNARIPAVLGCYSTIGWLLKVADEPKAPAASPVAEQSVAPGTTTPAAAVASPNTAPAPSQGVEETTKVTPAATK